MRISIRLEILALIQKVMGWAMVILSATSDESMPVILFGCLIGALISEMSDVWYKVTCDYRKTKKSAC